VIGTFTEERIPSFPEVPTAKELGYDIKVEKFRGIMTSKDTSDEVVSFLASTFESIMKNSEDFKKFYTSNDMVPAFLGPEAFAQYLDTLILDNKVYLTEVGMIKK
jgi:putative tricarboxylic transport membrane protein